MSVIVGFSILMVGFIVVIFAGCTMIHLLNRDPDSEGKIPFYGGFGSFGVVYTPVKRYRIKNGNDSLYKILVLGWIIFGIGFITVIGSGISDGITRR